MSAQDRVSIYRESGSGMRGSRCRLLTARNNSEEVVDLTMLD